MPILTPCLWFDTQAEEAANFYVDTFPDSKITGIARYTEAGPGPVGQVMTVNFELGGKPFLGLNGGPQFTFSEAISFQVDCQDQDEVDHYWDTLVEGGEESMCGWLKDRFGLSWQIVPRQLAELLSQPDPESAQRVMNAMLTMRKIQIDELERAAAAG